MKFRTEKRTRLVDTTIDGKTHQTEQTYTVKIPKAPRDWDQIATKVGVGLVGALTLVSVVWSTLAIGDLLGGGVGLAAAAMFDISWAVCIILEWKSRFDPDKRRFPRNLGWALLAATMFFIGWHGIEENNVALAVVGSCVSLFAKVLWLGIMKHVDRDLSPEHLAWVKATESEANAKMAVAEVKRRVARLEGMALAETLSLEAARRDLEGYTTVDAEVVNDPEPVALGGSTSGYDGKYDTPPADSTSARTTPSYPARTISGGEVAIEGSVAGQRGYEGVREQLVLGTNDEYEQGYEQYTKEQAVVLMAKMMSAGYTVTYNDAMKMFKRPKQTVAGWVREAKGRAVEGTGNYL